MISLRLSKAGYGTPKQILEMPTDVVVCAIAYEKFLQEYETAFVEMNRKD